ncbi:MAG TPA: DMT family transporter [Pyrinomonadaceae bacterium]|nr:DMT family transporter [Pyrinomonadaceae bacterium]
MSSRLRPHVALVLVQILFGSWPIFGKVVLRSMSSSSLVACRLTGAAIALAFLQRRITPLVRMPLRDIVLLTLCAMLGVVGNQFLFVKGLSLTTVINATLLSTTIPVYALAVSILFGYDKWSFKRLSGILLSALGVIYLINPTRADLAFHATAGNLLILTNSLLYAIYIVISKDLFERYGALNVITWIFLVGSVVTVPVGIYALQQENLAAIGINVWASILFIILFPTVGAYYLNAWALTRVSPSTVAIYIYLQPLVAFGFAPLLLGEDWNSRTLLAAVLIFGGVALVTIRGRSQAVREISEHPEALAR